MEPEQSESPPGTPPNMVAPILPASSAPTPERHANFLRDKKEELLQRWVDRVLADPTITQAAKLDRPSLLNHVPVLVDELIFMLEHPDRRTGIAEYGRRVVRLGGHPASHARTRYAGGYSIREVLTELGHFRSALLELADDSGFPLRGEGRVMLHEALDLAVATIVEEMSQLVYDVCNTVIEQTSDGVIMIDEQMKVRLFNQSAALMHACEKNQYLSSPWQDSYLALDHGSKPMPKEEFPLYKAMRTKHPAWGTWAIKRPDGTLVDVSGTASPVSRPDGSFAGVVMVLRDETERTAQQAESIKLGQLRETFIGVLGHDLRNPLTSAKGFIDIMAQSVTVSDAEFRRITMRALPFIRRSLEKMERMTHEILDFTMSRLGQGIPLVLKPTELKDLCLKAIEEVEVIHPDKRILFGFHGDSEADLDEDRISQVISNLLTNALSYSLSNEAVVVTVDGTPETVILSVNNKGPVIAADLLPHLFDPFKSGQTSNGPDRHQGLGLGLYIVNMVVQAHHGKIEVISNNEQGTTFTVSLPKTRRETAHA